MTTRQAYYRGQWIDESQLSIPVADLGFALGVTVTERLRTFGGQLFRPDEHLRRMARSLRIVGLDEAQLIPEISSAMDGFIDRHAEQITPGDDWAVVAFATPGWGQGPTVAVHGFPLPFADWADDFGQGVSVHTSHHRQVPPNCWPTEVKCRSRMHYYLADQEARRREPRARAVLLDQQGFVGEASTANIVFYSEHKGLLTPCFDRVLPGVSVAVVEQLAGELGITFQQADIRHDELFSADEMWLTSTSICALPVVRCDDQVIGGGTPGPVFRKLLEAWGAMVGLDIAAQAEQFSSRRST